MSQTKCETKCETWWLYRLMMTAALAVSGCGSSELTEQQAMEQEKADAASNAGDNASDSGVVQNKRMLEDQED